MILFWNHTYLISSYFLALVAQSVSGQTQPVHWTVYQRLPHRLTWNEGSRFCAKKGGNLPTTKTYLSLNALITVLRGWKNQGLVSEAVWLGLHKDGTRWSSRWQWQGECSPLSSGSLTYWDWRLNEPNSPRSDFCARMVLQGQHYWRTYDCAKTFDIVCEFKTGECAQEHLPDQTIISTDLDILTLNDVNSQEACWERCLSERMSGSECVCALWERMSAVCRLLFGRWEVDLTDLGVVTLVDHHVMLKRCFSASVDRTENSYSFTDNNNSPKPACPCPLEPQPYSDIQCGPLTTMTTTETTTTATTTTTQPPTTATTTTTEPRTTVTTQDLATTTTEYLTTITTQDSTTTTESPTTATTTTEYLTTITTQDSTTTTESPTTATTQDSATTTTESLTTLTIDESTTTTTTESPTKVTTQDSTTMSSEVKTPLTTEASATTSLVTDTTTVRTTADDSNDAASVTNDVTTTPRTCADFSCLVDTTTVATPPRQDLTGGDVAVTTTEGMTTQHTNQDTTSHQFQVSSPLETMATDKEADTTSSMPFDVVTPEVDTSQRAKSTAEKKETFSFSTVNVSTTTGSTDKPLLCPCKRKVCFIRTAPPQPAELHLIPRKSTHLYQNTLKSVWTCDSPSQLVLAISVMVVTLVPMFLFIVCDFERLERLFGHRKTKAVHSGRI